MTKETYIRASKIFHQMAQKKGMITTLTQKSGREKCVIRKGEIDKRILEYMAALSNLRKEFDEI